MVVQRPCRKMELMIKEGEIMKSKIIGALCVFTLSAGVVGNAQARLEARAGGMVYDTDLDITWLADANYAKTSGYDADGLMNWADSNAWAEQLNFGGFDDWRLPFNALVDPTCDNNRDVGGVSIDFGFGCSGSEYGHLFYDELGGTAGNTILDSTDADLDLFINIQGDQSIGTNEYWASEIVGLSYVNNHFHFRDGYQRYYDTFTEMSAWAVRDGDVAVVPVPAAVWLLGSGLLGLVGVARRK